MLLCCSGNETSFQALQFSCSPISVERSYPVLRKAFGIILGFALLYGATACASAPAPAEPQPPVEVVSKDEPVPEVPTSEPEPVPTTPPQEAVQEPVQEEETIEVDPPLLVTNTIDTASFQAYPQTYFSQDADSVSVDVMIHGDGDWRSFAVQVGVNPDLAEPGQIQLDGDAVSSLVDIDAVSIQIAEERAALGLPAIDLYSSAITYNLVVLK